MVKLFLSFCLLCCLSFMAKAQLLGNYTINPRGGIKNYQSFNDAVDALIKNGVSGNVVFTVADGIYHETIAIPAIKGAGPSATVTFQGANSNPQACMLDAATRASTDRIGAINFEGARFIAFKNISIRNYQMPKAAALHISSVKEYASENLQFDNCQFITDSNCALNSISCGILISNTTGVDQTEYIPGNHFAFRKCVFQGGCIGLGMAGSKGNGNIDSLYIDSCVFNKQNGFGILAVNLANVNISRSLVHNMRAGATDLTAITLFDTWNCNITGNKVDCPAAVALWLTMDNVPHTLNTSYVVDNYFLGGSAFNAIIPIGSFSNTRNIIFYHNTFKTFNANTNGPNFTGTLTNFNFIYNVIEAGSTGEHCFAAPSKGFIGIIDNNMYCGSGKFYFGGWQKNFNTWRTNFPSLNAQSVYYTVETNNRIISIFAIVLGIALAISSYRIYQHRKHLRAERIITQQQEQEIVQLKAMMKGEEKERIRIAQELHDGIVSQLSAVKMNFNAVQHHHNSLQYANDFQEALQQLEDTTEDLRKTSQNMMPKILQQAGLEAAVQSFCEKVQKSSGLEIDFRVYGDIPRLNVEFELSIYRIIQELLQNIVKHAHARHALVHLSCYEELLSITVEDDGVGLPEQEVLTSSNGIGLNNIKDRLRVLNGKMDIQTGKDTGTAVYLEFTASSSDSALFAV